MLHSSDVCLQITKRYHWLVSGGLSPLHSCSGLSECISDCPDVTVQYAYQSRTELAAHDHPDISIGVNHCSFHSFIVRLWTISPLRRSANTRLDRLSLCQSLCGTLGCEIVVQDHGQDRWIICRIWSVNPHSSHVARVIYSGHSVYRCTRCGEIIVLFIQRVFACTR